MPDELLSSWADLKEALVIPPMSDEALRTFVLDYLAGLIFASSSLPAGNPQLVGQVFLPLICGGLSAYNPSSLGNIGLFYEYLSQSLPREINGYPMFTSVRLMSREDWDRARKAIVREQERLKTIEV